MFIDAELQFSDKQAVTSTSYSTNSVEIVPGLNAGIDMAAQIVVRSESGTDPTLSVDVEVSSDDATYTKLLTAKKPDGERVFSIPFNGIGGLKKYLRLRYVVGGISPEYTITAMLVAGTGFSSAVRIENVATSPRIE